MKNYSVSKIIIFVRSVLFYILLFSGLLEMFFFPGWYNFIGIIVSFSLACIHSISPVPDPRGRDD